MWLVYLLSTGALLGGLIWLLILYRMVRGAWWNYQFRMEGNPSEEGPGVSIIIPVRNEAAHLPNCLPSILEQSYSPFEVIVVNDRSTDESGELLEEYAHHENLTVIEGQPRPDDTWNGKPWALHQGVQQTSYDWLLFVDADIRFEDSRLLAGVMEEASTSQNQLYSLMPDWHCQSVLSKMIVPLFGLLLLSFYPLKRVNDSESPLALAAGGFLMMHRNLYDTIGGHEQVRDCVAEDLAIARRVQEMNRPLRVQFTQAVSTEAYRNLSEVVEGFSKHIIVPVGGSKILLTLTLLIPFFCFFFPLVGLFVPSLLTNWGIISLGVMLGIAHLFVFLMHTELSHSAFWALGLWPAMLLYDMIGWYALYRHIATEGVLWKGRVVKNADDRKG